MKQTSARFADEITLSSSSHQPGKSHSIHRMIPLQEIGAGLPVMAIDVTLKMKSFELKNKFVDFT